MVFDFHPVEKLFGHETQRFIHWHWRKSFYFKLWLTFIDNKTGNCICVFPRGIFFRHIEKEKSVESFYSAGLNKLKIDVSSKSVRKLYLRFKTSDWLTTTKFISLVNSLICFAIKKKTLWGQVWSLFRHNLNTWYDTLHDTRLHFGTDF